MATVSIAIAPANDLPLANADAYATNEDTLLTVTAPGVLANDSDPARPALTAVLVRGPLHGTLTKFAANGSFKYKPAPNFQRQPTRSSIVRPPAPIVRPTPRSRSRWRR